MHCEFVAVNGNKLFWTTEDSQTVITKCWLAGRSIARCTILYNIDDKLQRNATEGNYKVMEARIFIDDCHQFSISPINCQSIFEAKFNFLLFKISRKWSHFEPKQVVQIHWKSVYYIRGGMNNWKWWISLIEFKPLEARIIWLQKKNKQIAGKAENRNKTHRLFLVTVSPIAIHLNMFLFVRSPYLLHFCRYEICGTKSINIPVNCCWWN